MVDETLADMAMGREEHAHHTSTTREPHSTHNMEQAPMLHIEGIARADTPTDEDISTPTQETPTKPLPTIITTTTSHDEPEEELATSPQPHTPTGPSTPVTPHDELQDLHDPYRDSMSSVALSQSSLDYDHLSTKEVEDVLATPRVSGARRHLRKVSSLDILQNKWAPPDRPSTLFDTSDESIQPMSAMELERNSQDFWTRDGGSSFDAGETNHESGPTDASLDTIDTLEPGHPAYISRNGSMSEASHRTSDGSSSDDDVQVDWQALEKTEKQEKADKDLEEDADDESTAFLLARLEQENAKIEAGAMAASIKSGKSRRARAASRPPSMAQLKKLVSGKDTSTPSIRFSLASDTGFSAETPPMTELEFWVALVQDYPSTAARLPTLTTTKIRAGIPAPLRGVVWTTLAGARDRDLEDAFDRLVHEKSPYEGIINKDVGRSFPGVELFREADGEGQQMLGRVLKCFSLQDKDIGYCQGLGFLVGPLLMNMPERDAFCVLTRMMDHYSLRPSFLPSLSGLHMRIYQFSSLLKQHHSKLYEHLGELGIEPAYLSQWFLSCFAVTCPLDMLFRVYDVIFAEGANETVMRVALALMRRHEEQMLATTEFEEVMQLLLGREMWDCYGGDADMLVDDFTSLGDIVTHARLAELEKEFAHQSSETVGQSAGFLPDVQAAASRFLGRIWAPGHGATPSKTSTAPTHSTSPSVSTLSPPSTEKDTSSSGYSLFGRPTSFLRRSPSKQDIGMINDTNSSEDSTSTAGSSAASLASTTVTEPDTPTADAHGVMRESMADSMSTRSKAESMAPGSSVHSRETMELHAQVEDLLIAIGEMQREHAQLAAMLQREREERTEDQRVMRQLVGNLRKTEKDDRRRTMPPPQKKMGLEVPSKGRPLSVGSRTIVENETEKQHPKNEIDQLLDKAQVRLSNNSRFSASLETKAQLRSTLARTREQLEAAAKHSSDLTSRLEAAEASVTTFQTESEDLQSEVTELRSRVAEEFKTRQKLEHQLSEFKAQARSIERKERLQRAESLHEVPTLGRNDSEGKSRQSSITSLPAGSSAGLRELKLGRRDSSSSVHSLRLASRNTIPVQTEVVLPTIQKDAASSEEPSPTSVSPASSTPATVPAPSSQHHPLAVPRTGFARRTTSLATREVLATTQHEPMPEDALLLELVNAKTSEAQARQEVDELKKALSVGKRKQEEALKQLQAEMELLKAEAVKAAEAAQNAKSESEALRLSQLAPNGTTLFSLPPTPALEAPSGFVSGGSSGAATPVEEKDQPIVLPKKAETAPAAAGGWFWQRRAASKSGIPPAAQKDGE
ncbi:hypothetical protein DOTSEDRAFT_70647 [Dothistroma septosporum NZE10]|uniref:Rab-GAP TBC domain-containing protein n=1 Tax=Dothistroma septosporum (strain NZE10 / CBS 128990) TaxID=675120 RepID=N1PTB7_DOTSN|nr:hypothetical protein DOTSEDRAFT_70647 [Dothistroma septosporum NZE10]